MDNTKKILIGLFVVLAIAVIILFFVMKKKTTTPAKAATTNTGNNSNSSSGNNTPAVSYDYPIVYNKYSNAAKALQAVLGVTQDGIIGPNSLAAWQALDSTVPQNFTIPDQPTRDGIITNLTAAKGAQNALQFSQQYIDIIGNYGS